MKVGPGSVRLLMCVGVVERNQSSRDTHRPAQTGEGTHKSAQRSVLRVAGKEPVEVQVHMYKTSYSLLCVYAVYEAFLWLSPRFATELRTMNYC